MTAIINAENLRQYDGTFSLIVEKICCALRDLVPFAQFKKSEKHPWRSVWYKWYQIKQRITYWLSLEALT